MPTSSRAKRGVFAALALGAAAAVCRSLVLRFRRDIDGARARLATVDRQAIPTAFGALEFAERGDGQPVLVIHGIFHGCDGALLSARDLVSGHRVIAPSRFGYLGSTLPTGAIPADQADAFALLLDRLGIERIDVIGISAGTTSALQFAQRHPDRVEHLAIVSGNLPGSRTAVTQPSPSRLLYKDPPMWALKVFAPSLLARLMGVPKRFPRSADDAQFVSEMANSVFPVAPRAEGIAFDAFISNADVNNAQLETLKVPTLIVHARDDPLASYDAAQRAAERIPGAVLLTVESGGHLMLGQTERVRTELEAFLATHVAA